MAAWIEFWPDKLEIASRACLATVDRVGCSQSPYMSPCVNRVSAG